MLRFSGHEKLSAGMVSRRTDWSNCGGTQPAPPMRNESGLSCRLHADDVGAELREVARGDGGGDAVAEFEDAETLEREPHLAAVVHARGTLLTQNAAETPATPASTPRVTHTGEQQRGAEAQRRREVGFPITDPGVDGAHRERRQHLAEAARVR